MTIDVASRCRLGGGGFPNYGGRLERRLAEAAGDRSAASGARARQTIFNFSGISDARKIGRETSNVRLHHAWARTTSSRGIPTRSRRGGFPRSRPVRGESRGPGKATARGGARRGDADVPSRRPADFSRTRARDFILRMESNFAQS